MSNNKWSKERSYRKKKLPFLSKLYTCMSRRVRGKSKPHIYKGLEILPRVDFINWAIHDKDFLRLHHLWELSDYDTKLTPSINRIDSSKGYILSNIEFITHSENSSLGNYSRHYGGTVR